MAKMFWSLEDDVDEALIGFEVFSAGECICSLPSRGGRDGMGLQRLLRTQGHSRETGVIWSTGMALNHRLLLQSEDHKLTM